MAAAAPRAAPSVRECCIFGLGILVGALLYGSTVSTIPGSDLSASYALKGGAALSMPCSSAEPAAPAVARGTAASATLAAPPNEGHAAEGQRAWELEWCPGATGRRQAEERPCQLRICGCDARGSARLYVLAGGDAAGAKMKAMLNALAWARMTGLAIGGFHADNYGMVDGHNFTLIVDRFFGPGSARELLLPKHPPEWYDAGVIHDFGKLEHNMSLIAGKSQALITNFNGFYKGEQYWSSELLADLQRPLLRYSLNFKPGAPSVAIHVRRGDVGKSNATKKRLTPDDYFFTIIDFLRKELPAADVHIFSSTVNDNKRTKGIWTPGWGLEEFDGYRQRGATLHLDDPDLVEVWAYMIRADVFVMDWSAFSLIPGVLNSKCVLRTPHDTPLRMNWHAASGIDAESLRTCMHHQRL